MKYIILHNKHDKASRDFVKFLPELKEGDNYEIVDWYEDAGARFSYLGPPPSSFPSVAFENETGFFIIREPESWQEVDNLVASSLLVDSTVKLSRSEKNEFVGGQRPEELEDLLTKSPQYFKNWEEVKAKITSIKGKRDAEQTKKLG